jgi:hypothetical protein
MCLMRKYWLATLLVGMIFLLTVAWATSIIPHHVNDCTYNYETYAEKCVPKHTLLFALRNIFEFIEHNDKIIGALSGIAVAAFTGTLWWSTRKLWRVTNATLDHTEKTTKRQLRAYVMIEKVFLEAEPNPPNNWAIHIEIKNFGQTPAYGVIVTSEYELTDPKGDELIFLITTAAQKHARTIMGPSKVLTLRLPCNVIPCYLTNGTFGFTQMSNAGKRAYVWGRIDYTTFDEHRWLTFQMVCHMGQVTAFGFCEAGNDADDQYRQDYNS